jgi:predicted dehydrogenase
MDRINRMLAACEKNGVKLAGIFNNRYREGNAFVKNAIERGRFGKLINANAYIRWYREPDYYLRSPWRGTWALDGGGALMNQGIHYVDLLLWLAGAVESVCAYTGTLLHSTIETEDTAAAILKFKSGALGTIIAGTSLYPGFPGKIEITGVRGSAILSDGVIEAWQFMDKDDLDEEAADYMNCEVDNKQASDPMAFDHSYHKKQIQEIIDDFKNGREPRVNGYEAGKSVELILSIYESSKQSKILVLS